MSVVRDGVTLVGTEALLMLTGIYRQNDWAVLAADDGSRTALRRCDYEGAGLTPPFDHLQTDDVYHCEALANGGNVSHQTHNGYRPL